MHWRRRLLDAIRSPARVVALTRRVLALWRRGELAGCRSPARRRRVSTIAAIAHGRLPCGRRRPQRRPRSVADGCGSRCSSILTSPPRPLPRPSLPVPAGKAILSWRARPTDCGDRSKRARRARRRRSRAGCRRSRPTTPIRRGCSGSANRCASTRRCWRNWSRRSCRRQSARVVYTDDDRLDAAGRAAGPRFKSAWDRERILETNDVGRVLAVDASLADVLPTWPSGDRR